MVTRPRLTRRMASMARLSLIHMAEARPGRNVGICTLLVRVGHHARPRPRVGDRPWVADEMGHPQRDAGGMQCEGVCGALGRVDDQPAARHRRDGVVHPPLPVAVLAQLGPEGATAAAGQKHRQLALAVDRRDGAAPAALHPRAATRRRRVRPPRSRTDSRRRVRRTRRGGSRAPRAARPRAARPHRRSPGCRRGASRDRAPAPIGACRGQSTRAGEPVMTTREYRKPP